MMLFVKTLKNLTITINLEPTDNVGKLVELIYDKEGMPHDTPYRLIFRGKQLDYGYSYQFVRIDDMDTNLHLKDSIFKIDSEGHLHRRVPIPSGGKSMKDLNIQEYATIHMVLNLRGGMFHSTSGRLDMIPNHHCTVQLPNNQQITLQCEYEQMMTACDLLKTILTCIKG